MEKPWELLLDCLDDDDNLLLFKTADEAGLYAKYIHGEKILRRYYEDLERESAKIPESQEEMA